MHAIYKDPRPLDRQFIGANHPLVGIILFVLVVFWYYRKMRLLFPLLMTILTAAHANGSLDTSSCRGDTVRIDSAQHSQATKHATHGIVPFSEVIGQNILVWSWDRFVLQKHYAEISLSTMRSNMRNGFTWDANHYAINYFGHPYQGTMYYNAARSSGYGFYPSLAYTALGSFTWEVYMEREMPSTNDLIVTSLGGATLGEVLYRLSARLEDHPRSNPARDVGAFAFSPMASINRAMLGKRGSYPGYIPLDLSLYMGAGSHIVSNYSYANEDVEDSKTSWRGKSMAWGMDLSYGKPGRRVNEPFDHFTIHYNQIADNSGTLLDVETMAVLKNMTMGFRKNWMDLGLIMDYDVMYGDLVEMSANSVGPSIEFNINLNERIRLQMANRFLWVMLGASDFNYEDVLVAQDSSLDGELRTYQFGTGFNYKNMLEIEWNKHGLFRTHSNLYVLRTMPKSAPHYGATGYDIVAKHDGVLEVFLPANWALGYRVDAYWKIAAYRKFEPLARVMATNWLYAKYNF